MKKISEDSIEFVRDKDSKFLALWQLLYHYLKQEDKVTRTGIVDVVARGKISRYKISITMENIPYDTQQELKRLKRRIEKYDWKSKESV